MQIYLVGGAVRDRLLGEPVGERDWVVVGATPEEMTKAGYRQVGRSFPVFIHPDTGEEYALARTERKTGPGYHGFEFDTAPTVTLEQDLRRRDLTINAMAEDPTGAVIDPYGGRADLDARRLRHVSDAFREDPVRILRVARFAARFKRFGFSVESTTLTLMRDMVAAGEADALVAERVWRETESALATDNPDEFLRVLQDCGALRAVYPELAALFGVPQPAQHHPEVDTGVHVLLALAAAARLSPSPEVRFAVMCHDLGKGETPAAEWPKHHGHERRGAKLLHALCDRVGAPNRFRELAEQVTLYHGLCHRADELKPATILKLLENTDAFRRPARFAEFLLACEADARGRTGLEDNTYPQASLLAIARDAAAAVQPQDFLAAGLSGAKLGAALREARIAAIAATRRDPDANERPAR
ncbi:MAG: multifunctional CCA addition/repair protein [Gammaproteobacteria bacterium]|nr:multifunctional CCA addition/repair protein [Gammaproteobacteria bacterium]